MKIDFSRDFKLNEKSLAHIINNYGNVSINNNIFLNLSNIKKSLRFIPIKSKGNNFKFSNILGSVRKEHGKFIIYIGNKKITTLKPDYFKMSNSCISNFDIVTDGINKTIPWNKDFYVKDNFKIIAQDDIRVNIIGFKSKKYRNENNLKINFKNLQSWYAVDKAKKTYRVEFYKDDKFCFMSKVHFN
jgi:hypothetical protein